MSIRSMCYYVAIPLAMLLWSAVHVIPSLAQAPSIISYQGVLQADTPIPEEVELTFAFYPDQEDEMPLGGWTETHSNVPVQDGRFSVLIGSVNAESLPPELLEVEEVYLEVRVNGESLPRLRLASTPFALRSTRAVRADSATTATWATQADSAEVARRVPARAIDTDALADGAVTQGKLASDVAISPPPNSVTSAEIQDGSIQGEDLQNRAIGSDQIANGAVGTNQIGNQAVTQEKIASNAIASSQIVNKAIAGIDINDDTVVRSISGPDGTALTDDLALQGGENVDIVVDDRTSTITISVDGSFLGGTQPSSRRWKTNIRDLDGALELVEQLRGVRFTWKDDGRDDVGLIAEEVGAVVPEVVTYEENGVDAQSVNYARLVALLVEAVKTQQHQLVAARQKVDTLEERVARLERLLPSAEGDPTSANDTIPERDER